MLIPLLEETSDAAEFIGDDAFCAQEKIDGVRLLIVRDESGARGFTRNRLEWPLPASVIEMALPVDSIIDGELIGGDFIAFDVQRIGGRDVSSLPYAERFAMLAALPFRVVRHAIGSDAKARLLDAVRAESGEGIVFKRLDAPVRDGRSDDAIKFKFYRSDSFVVADTNIARGTIGLRRFDRDCGRVTFPFNGRMPKPGEVVEVRYDRLTSKGKLARPILIGVRDDIIATNLC